MARPESQHPTELELEILKTLWRESPASVRDVQEALAAAGRDLAYSTVITMLNIMHRKQFVQREKVGRNFLFSAKINQKSTSGNMVSDLLHRAFSGSSSALVLSLLETNEIDADELSEIRKLVAQKLKDQKK